jgi:small subunit ribosomal protein S4
MARYTGPKHRQARRLGINILEKTSQSLERRLNVLPGAHGKKGIRRKVSDYSVQLKEKQKAKKIYGVLEKQFRRIFKEATKEKGATGQALLRLLELRLDNVVYKLGFAPSRPMARQLVSHGHIMVNGKKMDIPSYEVKLDETVSIQGKALEIPVVKKLLEDKKMIMPAWVERKAAVGKIVRLPQKEDLTSEINEQLIVEYYSR